jgi:transglutaminase-like putative cysteine protease
MRQRAFQTVGTFLFLLLTPLLSASAKSLPDWAQLAVEQAAGLEFDEDAEIVILYRSARVEIGTDGRAKRLERVVKKALRTVSGEDIACAEYICPDREVKGFKGWRLDSFGDVHSLKKENVAEFAYQESAGNYDDAHMIAGQFNEVEVGDVVAFEYRISEKRRLESLYQSFTFQSYYPVAHSRFEVVLPEGWQIHVSGQRLEPIESEVAGNSHIWETSFLPFHKGEPFMPAYASLARYVVINCYNPSEESMKQFDDWNEVSQWAWGLHNEPATTSDELAGAAAEIVAGATTPEEKLRAIAEYVRGSIRYVAVEIGIGRFKPRLASETWKNKFGDCKDKVTLARSLLSAVGIDSRPVLALSGGDIKSDVPSPFQFNHVILGVPLETVPGLENVESASTDGYLFFDPTDEATPLGRLPTSLYGSKVLVVSDTETDLLELPKRIPEDNHRRYDAEISLTASGSIDAQVKVTDYGNLAANNYHWREQTAVVDQIENIHRQLSKTIRSPEIASYEYNHDGDSAWYSYSLKAEGYVTSSGDLDILKMDPFHADRKNLIKKKGRMYPIWFGHSGTTETNIIWTLPDKVIVNELPDSISFSSELGEMVRYVVTEDQGVRFYCRETFAGKELPPEQFLDGRRFERARNKVRSSRVFLQSR